MKTFLIALIFCFGTVLSTNAQTDRNQRSTQAQQEQNQISQQKDEQQPDPRERAKTQTEMMARNYDLTETQLKRLTDENRSFYTKMYNVRNRYSNDKDYQLHRDNTIKDHERIMKGILSNEQYNDYMHNRASYYKDLEINPNTSNDSAPQKDNR